MSSKRLGFSFRYPGGWKLLTGNPAFSRGNQVTVAYQGAANYSLSAALLPFAAAGTLGQTVNSFVAYQRASTHSGIYAHIHWTSTNLGGKPAVVGVLRPSTEGGVELSDGIYLAQWRSRAYEVTIVGYHRPPFARLGQFPVIYRQILSTWRFF